MSEIILPSGYKKVDYIQRTTNQYIDTGVVPNSTTMMQTKINMYETTGGMIIGYSNSTSDLYRLFNYSNNLIEIINNVLDLSRIETNSEIVIEEEYKLKDILSELKSVIDSRINDDVSFDIVYNEYIPSTYIGDKNKIYKILLNLLSNSVKYTEVGKINLNVENVNDIL